MAEPTTAIQVRGLTKRFGDVTAVDDLSFDVPAGEVVGFLGTNGAGKTTTLRMLLGLAAPTRGRALINGLPYADLPDPLHTVGAALEASNFHPGRTARAHMTIHALAADTPPRRVEAVLAQVDLTDAADRRVGGFSLGMRQRLELATALLHDPDILILDEPANGLDPQGMRWLRDLIRGLAAGGHTMVVSSHVLAEVAQIADSVIIVDHGQLVLQSSLADLNAQGGSRLRVRTPKPSELGAALATAGIPTVAISADQIEVAGATGERVGTLAAQNGIPIFETAAQTPDLEDLFLELISTSREEVTQ
jgi:ABC-2 type transport system ATP-binding protein